MTKQIGRPQEQPSKQSSATNDVEPEPVSPIEIERNPERCGGRPTLAGTRTTVDGIVTNVQLCGGDVRRMVADFPDLTMETVEAVMAWYADHREEIDGIIQRRREDYRRLLAQQRADG